jgi:capsular exopolysaccharide synthesis family protein
VAQGEVVTAPSAKTAQISDKVRWARGVLWRGKGLLLAVLLLVVVPTFVYLQQVKPQFTAGAEILIEAPDGSDTLLDRNNPMRARLTDATILTESQVLASTPLVRRVIEKLQLDQDPEFNVRLRKPSGFSQAMQYLNPVNWMPEEWRGSTADQAVLSPEARAEVEQARITGAVLSRLVVRPQRRSFVIEVTFTSESREKAAKIINTLADLYVLDRLEAGFDETRRITSWLSERLEGLRRDVSVAEAAAETYRAANGLRRSSERQGTISDQQLTELNSRLVLGRADMAQKQARLEQVRALTRGRGNVETAYDVLQSQLIQRLREQEVNLQREMSEALKTYGDRHPRLIALRADMTEMQVRIRQEVEKIAASVANELEVSATGVRALERSIADLRKVTDSAGGAEIRLRELERDAEASRQLYESFLGRFKRDSEQDGIQRANARVLSPATVPTAPSYPRKPPILVGVFLLALALGTGLLFLLEKLDRAVRSSDEAEDLTGLPVFAAIPLRRQKGDEVIEDEVVSRPRSALADAFRTLRTGLVLSDDAAAAKVVMITSSVPEEGKSFAALGLARLFAKSGERVLLIDGDLHRPRLHKPLKTSGDVGLIQVLNGEAPFEPTLVRDTVGGLDFLPAGKAAVALQAEMFNGTAMPDLLAELRGRYDRIILDAPPTLAVADTRLLACMSDKVLYMIRWNKTPRDAVRAGIKLLRESRAPLAGVALSKVDARKHARYGYGDYGQYYGRYGAYYSE